MKHEIIDIVQAALKRLEKQWELPEGIPKFRDIEVEIPRNESLGDITTTLAMSLAKTLKKPPREIAQDIVNAVKASGRDGIFEKIEVAGAGFINFTFKKEYLYNSFERLLKEEYSFLRVNIGSGRKVQIEFVSANPTGPLHIGHGRGAAVGNALSNILQAAGYKVQKEYYINDAGVQVRMLGQSVYARYQQMLGNDIKFPENGYHGAYIESIAEEIIKNAGNKYLGTSFDECGNFFMKFAYKKMLAQIANDLRDFGVAFDRWQSEKELYEKGDVEDSLAVLRQMGLLYKQDDALWFASAKFGDDKDRVVVKKDGEYTYFASDIAYHKDKLDRKFDTIIDIWGADHHGYIPRLRSVLKAFGLPEKKFKVILIQMVSLLRHGKLVQMSKRSGEFITLREVIEEVGADTAKFIFLTRRADSHLDFDIDIAKEQSAENPVFYVQYAFARIVSIFRQAEEKGVQGFKGLRVQGVELLFLKEAEEISIIKKLLQYPMLFEGAALSFEPHRITFYLQELAKLFHSYYNKHRVITDNEVLTSARLCLCRAVQAVLEEGLKMLGVSAPERM
ncbi:MAG: arginine--tRNA ligase [Nitrospirae bacterium]|nr:arginine--tRNA ligase [Nitrospirota bacterium]